MLRSPLKSLASAPDGAVSAYIIPGLGGHPLQFRPLAAGLLPEIGLVGVLYPVLLGDDSPVTTIKELGTRMVTAFDHVESPIILCGHSFGGTIAYEIACQLRRKNHQVSVVLLDAAVGSLRRKRGRIFRGVRNLFIAWPLRLIGIKKPPRLQANHPKDPRLVAFRAVCRAAARNFRPAESDIPIVLIRAEAKGRFNWVWNRYWPSRDFGWSKVAPVAKVIFCPGDHVSIVQKAHRADLVNAVAQAVAIAHDHASNLSTLVDRSK